MKADPELKAYFAEAASWDADRAAQARRAVRLALGVAGAGWIATLLLTGALLLLMPLKRVEPFVVRVDNTTGVVDVVPVYSGKSGVPEAVTRYLLTHYVTVCERFNYATAESDYEECGAFHNAARNQAWFAEWDRSNPSSPLNLYKDGTSIRAQVAAVSFFTRAGGLQDLAQVRYTKAARAGGGSQDQVTHWIATVQFTYGEPSKDPRIRRWDPLGFKVVDFRAEPEIPPADSSAPTMGATSAAGSKP